MLTITLWMRFCIQLDSPYHGHMAISIQSLKNLGAVHTNFCDRRTGRKHSPHPFSPEVRHEFHQNRESHKITTTRKKDNKP